MKQIRLATSILAFIGAAASHIGLFAFDVFPRIFPTFSVVLLIIFAQAIVISLRIAAIEFSLVKNPFLNDLLFFVIAVFLGVMGIPLSHFTVAYYQFVMWGTCLMLDFIFNRLEKHETFCKQN